METTTKVIEMPSQNDNSLAMMLAMNNNQNQWMNNPLN